MANMALPQCLCRHWGCQSARRWSSGGVTPPHTSSPGTWQKLALGLCARVWIFSSTTGAYYRSKKTSFPLDNSFGRPEGSRIGRPSALHLVEAAPPKWPRAGRSWNVSWCSFGYRKVDPLRWPHLGKMPYLRRIAELCLLYHPLKWRVLNRPFVLDTAQKPTLEKSGNVWLKGLRVPYGREPYSIDGWRPAIRTMAVSI